MYWYYYDSNHKFSVLTSYVTVTMKFWAQKFALGSDFFINLILCFIYYSKSVNILQVIKIKMYNRNIHKLV